MLTIVILVVSLLVAVQGQSSLNPAGLNITEQQVMQRIDTLLLEVNEYLTQFLELILKMFKAVSEFIIDIQNHNTTTLNFAQLTRNIQQSFSISNETCYKAEKASYESIISNTTVSIQNCFSNVDIQVIVPQVEIVLTDVIDTARNVSSGLKECFDDNPMMFGLPACIIGQVRDLRSDFDEIQKQVNVTITKVNVLVNSFMNDTLCLQSSVSQASSNLRIILQNFIDCIIG